MYKIFRQMKVFKIIVLLVLSCLSPMKITASNNLYTIDSNFTQQNKYSNKEIVLNEENAVKWDMVVIIIIGFGMMCSGAYLMNRKKHIMSE